MSNNLEKQIKSLVDCSRVMGKIESIVQYYEAKEKPGEREQIEEEIRTKSLANRAQIVNQW